MVWNAFASSVTPVPNCGFFSAKRIRKLWMDRVIAASVPILEFGMAPCFVPRIEKAAARIAAFTNVNIAVHGPIYNGFITTAVNALA